MEPFNMELFKHGAVQTKMRSNRSYHLKPPPESEIDG